MKKSSAKPGIVCGSALVVVFQLLREGTRGTGLAHDLVGGIHPLIGEVLENWVVESETWEALTLIRDPCLPDGLIGLDPSTGDLFPCVACGLLIQQHGIHLALGQVEVISKLVNHRSQNDQVLTDQSGNDGLGCLTGKQALAELTTIVLRIFHHHRVQLQESWIWRPPIQRHVNGQWQLCVVAPSRSDCNGNGHVEQGELLHELFHCPTNTSGDPWNASSVISPATWGQPPKAIIASGRVDILGSRNQIKIT